jgi:hypothetical protein
MGPALAAACLAAALAACGSKEADRAAPAPAAGSAAGSPRADAAPAAPELPAAVGPLAEACGEYRRVIEQLAACGDALPEATREELRAHFEQRWVGWEQLPEPEQRALAEICQRSAEAVAAAAGAACGWEPTTSR